VFLQKFSCAISNVIAFLTLSLSLYIYIYIYVGYAVAQWVEALRYKLEGREFDSR